MHHKKLASAVEKYGHLSGSIAELVQALKEDEKGWTDEDINEIFTAITQPKAGKEPAPASPQKQTTNKPYDKWRGTWKAHKGMKDAKGETVVTQWIFVYEGEGPNKTGIPMAESQVDIFNKTRYARQGKMPTEQLVPAGTKPEIIDIVVNPNEEIQF